MKIIEYVVLAIIQGFTEPLPISSSGHLRIFKSIFTSDVLSDLNFEIILNFASLIAICFLYRDEIVKIIKEFFMYIKTKDKKYETNYKYAWYIVIATIPCAFIGLFLKDILEEYFTTKLVGLMLIITALLLYIIKDKKGSKDKKDMTIKDALVVGLFQVIALLPGISRSGATIVGAMETDLKRDTAIKFSFMLYIPISIATFILGVKDLLEASNIDVLAYLISMVVTTIVTYFSAKLFINIMKKGKLIYFSIYCLIVGLVTFIVF